jgi:hypothetical protein
MSDQPRPLSWPAQSNEASNSALPLPASRSRSAVSDGSESTSASDSEVMGGSNAAASGSRPPAYATASTSAGKSAVQGSTGPGRTVGDKGKTVHQIAPGPSQGHAGASAGSTQKVKRKRDGEGKRKKVAKACLVCQKSHLTCDESE